MLNYQSGHWEKVWIGGDGVRVDFVGGPMDDGLILSEYWNDLGGPGIDALIKITWTPHGDGSVRQAGEASGDHGENWQPIFDYTYRRNQS